MLVHRIFCGLNSPQLTPDQAEQCVLDLILIHFPNGYTLHRSEGGWKDHRNPAELEIERSLIVEVWEVDGFGRPAYEAFATDYKELGFQECVAVLSAASEAILF